MTIEHLKKLSTYKKTIELLNDKLSSLNDTKQLTDDPAMICYLYALQGLYIEQIGALENEYLDTMIKIKNLPAIESAAILMRYHDKFSVIKIADKMFYSERYVYKILKSALNHLGIIDNE